MIKSSKLYHLKSFPLVVEKEYPIELHYLQIQEVDHVEILHSPLGSVLQVPTSKK